MFEQNRERKEPFTNLHIRISKCLQKWVTCYFARKVLAKDCHNELVQRPRAVSMLTCLSQIPMEIGPVVFLPLQPCRLERQQGSLPTLFCKWQTLKSRKGY